MVSEVSGVGEGERFTKAMQPEPWVDSLLAQSNELHLHYQVTGTSTSGTTKRHLLALPPEIRNAIYRYCVIEDLPERS